MGLFNGGVAVVTGAASGIGRATAIALVKEGCHKLMMGDLSLTGMEGTCRIIAKTHPDSQLEIKELDISDRESVDAFYAAAVERYGRIDYAASVAGVAHPAQPLHELTEATFDKQYAVNQKGAFLCQRAIIRQMLRQERRPQVGLRGSIVVVTSQLAQMTCLGMAAYTATKAGARGLCRADALDYGPEGIRVNTVGPGPTTTPLLLEAQKDEYIHQMEMSTPLRRNASPEDIANSIVWLLSDRASFITGVSLVVDGGMGLELGPD